MNKDNNLIIAKRIKDLREFCDYDTATFASMLGMLESEYIEYESAVKDIPIGTFYNIATALSIDPTVLLTGEMATNNTIQVVYGENGKDIERYPGYSYKSLADQFIGRKMEPMIVSITNDVKPEQLVHNGQEFNYVLEGNLRVIVGAEEFYLHEGDSIFFSSTIPHSQLAMSDKAKFLTVISE